METLSSSWHWSWCCRGRELFKVIFISASMSTDKKSLLVASFTLDFFCHPFKIPKWKWHRDYNGQRFLFFHGWPYTRFYEQLAAATAAIQFDSTICHTFLMMIEGISAIFNIIFCLCHFIYKNLCAGNKLIKKVFFRGCEFLL